MDKKIASFHELQVFGDERGELVPIEFSELPFNPRRIYLIRNTSLDVKRGQHAHKNLKQLLVCLSGTFTLTLDDGSKRELYEMSKNHPGIIIDGIIWRELSNFSENCVVLVFADQPYSEQDYIRVYDEFLKVKSDDII